MGKPRKTVKDDQCDEAIHSDQDEIDAFYDERDENLRTALSKTMKKKSTKGKKSVSWALDNDDSDGNNDRDEVLAFDDDSMGSDDDDGDDDNEYQQIENDDDDLGEEINGSWGTSRKTFYNEDENGDEEDAKLEEQEAIKIQKKYFDMLQNEDFGLKLFRQKSSSLSVDNKMDEKTLRSHIISTDNLLQLNSSERLQLIRDQSPELEHLCNEFKKIFDDLKIYLLPFIQLVIDTSSLDEFHSYSGWQFVLSILELYLTYSSYLSVYLMMKSNDINLPKHPILEDIEQYRNLCHLIDEDFQLLKPNLLKLCEILQEKKTEKPQTVTSRPHLILKNGLSSPTKINNEIRTKPSLRERMIKRREEKVKEENNIESEEDELDKRPITRAIEKNKGLTVKRKKEYRNPRVRNRNKYARALIKRKSRVPTARTEEEKYVGEPTGIRAGIKRGIKLKS